MLLTDDAAVKRLNSQHRAKVKPTNVLSFPAGLPGQLGDVALALGVVRREAREAGRKTAAHFAHLVAHGALHLAGHDHLEAGEARRMERAEARVMRRLGMPNPWPGGNMMSRPARIPLRLADGEPGAHSATAPRPSAAPGASVQGAKPSRADERRPAPEGQAT